LSGDELPDGMMYWNIATRVILPILEQSYGLSATACETVQNHLNAEAGISLKAVVPEFEDDAAEGIMNLVASDKYEKVKSRFATASETMIAKVADRSVKENADYQYNSGMSPKIQRIPVGGCCEWCQKLGGTYEYEDVKNTGNMVFRRHANCGCLVVYVPVSGKKQDVHSIREYESNDEVRAEMQRREAQSKEERKAERERLAEIQKERSRLIKNANARRRYHEKKGMSAEEIQEKYGQRQATRKIQKKGESSNRDIEGSSKDDIIKKIKEDTSIISEHTPSELKELIVESGYDVVPLSRGRHKGQSFEDGGGYKTVFNGNELLEYHPSGGRHNNGKEYYKISSSERGVIWYDENGNEIDRRDNRKKD